MVQSETAITIKSTRYVGSHIGTIPVRNLWLLMLYASDLFRKHGHGKFSAEETPEDIPELVAEILASEVKRRLQRNLTFGYRSQEAVLHRVRGRIDILNTERHQLLARGMVACRFEDLTVNTPRNQFVRAALDAIAKIVSQRPELAHQCRSLANSLKLLGVTGEKPSRAEALADRFGRHDADDQYMVSAAQLAFDLSLPTEDIGDKSLPRPDRDIVWIRNLFERAVGGFYKFVLPPHGWDVSPSKRLHWRIDQKTSGIENILQSMKADIILEHNGNAKRIVIDTKFTSIIKPGRYRDEALCSGYMYQIYSYLRSQEGSGYPHVEYASGLLLHPAIGEMLNETVKIQGHAIRFATVDLGATAREIRDQLIGVIDIPDVL